MPRLSGLTDSITEKQTEAAEIDQTPEQTSRRESVPDRLSAADAENEIKALRKENSVLRGLLKEHGIEVKGEGKTAEHE